MIRRTKYRGTLANAVGVDNYPNLIVIMAFLDTETVTNFGFYHFRKVLIVILLISTFPIWCMYARTLKLRNGSYTADELAKINTAKQCYHLPQNDRKVIFLEDVLASKKQPNNSIFYHETSCSHNNQIALTARQACSIESAAKWNANRDIFVLFASPVGFLLNEPTPPIIKALQSYPNVHLRNVDSYKYAISTPAEGWLKKNKLFSSKYFISHLSDYLRFLSIWKFGGIHLDLDLIVQRNLDYMPPNFVGQEENDSINCAIMGFEADGIGHTIMEMILRENTQNYEPSIWAYSGPGSITRTLKKICHENSVFQLRPEICWGVKVFPLNAFYSILGDNWQQLFDTNSTVVNATLEATKNAIVTHIWNSLSFQKVIVKSEGKTAYSSLAEENCPKVYESCGPEF